MSKTVTAALRAVSQCRTVEALDELAVELSVAEFSEQDFAEVKVAVTERRHALQEIPPEVREALAVWRAGVPDGQAVQVLGAHRCVDARGNGSQTYRRVVYPGAKSSVWVDCERLPGFGSSVDATMRRRESFGEVPVGSLLLDYESRITRYRKSRATLTIGLVVVDMMGAPDILWLDHKRLRSRAIAVVTLPDGEAVEIEVER